MHHYRLKLVVFDCDGVLFNSREANRRYYNALLDAFSCPPMDEEELHYVHIHNVYDSVRYIFRNHDHVSLDAVNAYRRDTLDYRPYLRYMEMEPDLMAFLRIIKSRRYGTAISTNRTDTMETILDTFALRSWFDMVVTASTAPRPKPAPDGLEMILKCTASAYAATLPQAGGIVQESIRSVSITRRICSRDGIAGTRDRDGSVRACSVSAQRNATEARSVVHLDMPRFRKRRSRRSRRIPSSAHGQTPDREGHSGIVHCRD